MDFDEYVRARAPSLVRFASALCADGGLAEDVVQEVLLRMHRRWATVSEMDALDAYVRRAVVNEYFSWRRKWGRVTPFDVVPDARLDEPDPSTRHADRSQLAQQLAGLPPRQRAVLVLRYFEELPDAEIAHILGCRTVTVRGYASRGLAALRVQNAEHQRIDVKDQR